MPDLDRGDIPHYADPSAYDVDTCEGYGPAPERSLDDDNDDPRYYGGQTDCAGRPVLDEEEEVPSCSMCGATTHTERERTGDGEWDEDCKFHPFFDGDGNDLRRPGQAGRPRW